MATIDWNSIMGVGAPKKRYSGANVKFFNAYNENREKSAQAGRPIFDEIPSISIQWPGGDETVRRIEPQDIAEYPASYAAFQAGNTPVAVTHVAGRTPRSAMYSKIIICPSLAAEGVGLMSNSLLVTPLI